MPNGFHGAPDEWRRIELPLLSLDPQIEQFATEHRLTLSRNYHSWPERSLVSMDGSLRRLIQIYLESEDALTVNVWVCVSEDRGSARFWKKQFLRKDVPAKDMSVNFLSVLQEALELVRSWSSSDLEFAAELKRHS
jgi:hypothetical protein